MRGAGRLWRFSVRAVKFCAVWCIKFAFLCCAAPFLLCGLFFLFCAGLFVVLAAQGYPVLGVTVVSVGVVLAALGSVGILLSWVFTGKKSTRKRKNEERLEEGQEYRGEAAK